MVVWWYDNPENLVHHTTVIPRVPHPGCGTCGTVVVWWYAPRTREMTRTKQLNLLRYIGAQQTQRTAQRYRKKKRRPRREKVHDLVCKSWTSVSSRSYRMLSYIFVRESMPQCTLPPFLSTSVPKFSNWREMPPVTTKRHVSHRVTLLLPSRMTRNSTSS